jgi:hypothetical protein
MPPADRTEEARRRRRREYIARSPLPKRPPDSLRLRLLRGFLVYGIGKPVAWTFKIIFGWWLNPFMAGRAERRFRTEVREAFSFLFDEFGAEFVPYSEKSLSWDRTTLRVRGLLFRASRWRGDREVRVAPVHAPTSWESLYTLIGAIDAIKTAETGVGAPPAPLISGFSDFAQWIKLRFSEIEEALSPTQYARTVEAMERVEEIDRQKAGEWLAQWNERAKFYREHPEANPYKEKKQSGSIQSLHFKDL